MDDNKSIKSLKEHCAYCFDVILAKLSKEKTPDYPSNLQVFSSPLFVTWHINKDELRGCIGTFSPAPINSLLGKYALISAFQDSRFNPISKGEVEKLSVDVSLLVNFETGKDAYDWEIGKHGIIIEFNDKSGNDYNATFLPEVASEHGFTKDVTLEHLIHKAGYSKDWQGVVKGISLQRYQSSKCHLTYKEYLEMKKKII